MQITDFLNGLLSPVYAIFDSGFSPSTNFAQFIILALASLSMIGCIIKIFK